MSPWTADTYSYAHMHNHIDFKEIDPLSVRNKAELLLVWLWEECTKKQGKPDRYRDLLFWRGVLKTYRQLATECSGYMALMLDCGGDPGLATMQQILLEDAYEHTLGLSIAHATLRHVQVFAHLRADWIYEEIVRPEVERRARKKHREIMRESRF